MIFVSLSVTQAGNFAADSRSEQLDIMVRVRATQFLQRATFGPTQEEIDALTEQMKRRGVMRAASEWIDAQFEVPDTSHEAAIRQMMDADGLEYDQDERNIIRYRHYAWWNSVITGPDQLKQRIAWALSQIVVVSESGANLNNRARSNYGNNEPFWLGIVRYYDQLVENSDETYRDVLGDVTFSPIMGTYLSHLRNDKGDPSKGIFPDENYAREVLQLFTIGLYKLRLDGEFRRDRQRELVPTFDNDTIKSFSRLFTGLSFSANDRFSQYWAELHEPMKMFDDNHDQDPKELLNGFVLDYQGDGNADINAGLDHLYNHSNVAPFISRQLIQRLVRSNPSRGYLRRVSRVFNDNGSGVRGDLKAVVKAILLDRECWDSIRISRRRRPAEIRVRSAGTERTRLIEPAVMYAGLMRKYGSPSTNPNLPADGSIVDDTDGAFKLPPMTYEWPQAAYKSPSVFNFYSPDFQPAGPITGYEASRRIPNRTLHAPEFALLNSVATNRTANRYRADIRDATATYNTFNLNGTIYRTTIDFDFQAEEDILSNEGVEALVSHLDMFLCSGTMETKTRNCLVAALEEEDGRVQDQVRGGVIVTLLSPGHMAVE